MLVTHSYPPSAEAAFIELNAKFFNFHTEDVSDHDLFNAIRDAHWYYTDNWVSSKSKVPKTGNTEEMERLGLESFARKVLSVNPGLHQYIGRLHEIIDYGRSVGRETPRGRAILFDEQCKHFLVIQPYRGNHFVLPGGKRNQGESMLECAVRETREEIGFDSAGILTEQNMFEDGNSTYFYGKGVPSDGSVEFKPRTVKEVSSVAWVKVSSLKPLSKTVMTKNGKIATVNINVRVLSQISEVAGEMRRRRHS